MDYTQPIAAPCHLCKTSTYSLDKHSRPRCAICEINAKQEKAPQSAPQSAQTTSKLAIYSTLQSTRKTWSIAQKREAIQECIEHRAQPGNEGLSKPRPQIYKWARELGISIPRLNADQYKSYKPRNQ